MRHVELLRHILDGLLRLLNAMLMMLFTVGIGLHEVCKLEFGVRHELWREKRGLIHRQAGKLARSKGQG